MVQFPKTQFLDVTSHCSRKSKGLFHPFPHLFFSLFCSQLCFLLLALHLKVSVRSAKSCNSWSGEEFSWLSHTSNRSISWGGAGCSESKGKGEMEEEVEGMSSPSLSSSKLFHLSDCTREGSKNWVLIYFKSLVKYCFASGSVNLWAQRCASNHPGFIKIPYKPAIKHAPTLSQSGWFSQDKASHRRMGKQWCCRWICRPALQLTEEIRAPTCTGSH